MKLEHIALSVLTENTASGYFTAEHGLSYFIEFENKNILFDTGHTDVFLRNAKKITCLKKIKAVIGGFYLMKNNDQTKKTIEYFKEQSILQVFPSHCTKFPALVAFYNEFKIQQVTTGMIFNF